MAVLSRFHLFLAIIFTLIALAAVFSAATAQSVITVSNIEVQGNQRIEDETIKSFFGIHEGQRITPQDVDEGLSALFRSNQFADASVSLRGSKLVIDVVENPVISLISFEGNKRLQNDELQQEIGLRPRDVFTQAKLLADTKRVQELYRRSGRYLVKVDPKIINLEQNRVNLVFEIDEGQKATIARVDFVGNGAISGDKLRNVVRTKETKWWRFFSSDDNYDPDRLAFDQELLRRYYVANGYADFRVADTRVELSPDQESFFVTFVVDEGAAYNFAEIHVESEIPDISTEELAEVAVSHEGEMFNAEEVEKTVTAITDRLGDLGYAFVQVDPRYNRNPEDKTIGIDYVVQQGPRVYIEEINIVGNVRTLDEVVRREFLLAEGDPYNASKLKRSEQRVRNLGFFSDVNVKNLPGSSPDKARIQLAVEEQSTGELTFGAGFSTADGALGDVSVVERNLLGKGQYLKLNFTAASSRQQVDISFTEPYFMGKDIAAGFDLFKIQRDGNSSRTNRTFDDEILGGTVRASYPITEYLTHSVRYSLREDTISDVDSAASQFIQRQEGTNVTSLVGHSFIYDKRDNRQLPRDGYFIRLNQDVAGLGGDSKFFRHEVRGAMYQPLDDEKDYVVKLSGNAGHIAGFGGEDVRINHRFFVGNNEVRGFDNEGIGPRDSASGDPLGGNIYAAASAEVGFPLGLPEELGFRGALFADAGTLYESDEVSTATSTVLDSNALRASLGVGLSWNSPLGPIRIDFSEAVAKEDYDETETVQFSFGTRF